MPRTRGNASLVSGSFSSTGTRWLKTHNHIPAKWGGTCLTCKRRIARGEMCFVYKKKGLRCEECVARLRKAKATKPLDTEAADWLANARASAKAKRAE